MKISKLDDYSPRLAPLRARRAELFVEISRLKAQCAVIRDELQKGNTASETSQEHRVRQLIGNVL